MNLAPVTLEHGDVYGKLKVLRKRGKRYSVGCVCGFRFLVSKRKLETREVRACGKCAALDAGNSYASDNK